MKLTMCVPILLVALGAVAAYPDYVDSGYPQQISAKWIGVPNNVDAAFYRPTNGKMYFFKGESYWRVSDKDVFGIPNDSVDAGYPKNIASNFIGLPSSGIDGAFCRNGKIYFFVGTEYYRLTDKYSSDATSDAVDDGYPQTTSDKFVGLPEDTDIDAVFYRNTVSKIYFFVGGQYYRLQDKYKFELDEDYVESGYPKDTASNWVGFTGTPDATFQRGSNEKIYFFQGTQYYRITDKYNVNGFADEVLSGYPQSIAAKWLGVNCATSSTIPNDVDAVFQRLSNGKIYFFKGAQYWRVTDKYSSSPSVANDCVDAGYPKDIKTNWIGVPDSIDGVFQRSNYKMYFFKGDKYYRVTDKYVWDVTQDSVDVDYPQLIADKWVGVPNNIDDVFQRANKDIYFFDANQYYRVADKYVFSDDPSTTADEVDEGYPKSISKNWWGVPNNIDGVFQRSSNSDIYFFDSNKYYKVVDKYLKFHFTPVTTSTSSSSSLIYGANLLLVVASLLCAWML